MPRIATIGKSGREALLKFWRSTAWKAGAVLAAAWLLLPGQWAQAASAFEFDALGDKHHVTADRSLYHSRERVYEAFGHVVVSSQGQRLSSDYLWIDDNTKDIKARGNVVYVTNSSTVQAAELHFNLNTGFGAIFYGKVYNDLYTLKGQLIRRVEEDRYLTTEGEYTTCKDCAESWKISARNVDLTMDGYAFMDSVFIKIKDIPTLYLPYMVLPVKTRRQSGLLFPRMGGNSSHGFVYVQPLFLAIDKHQDATVSAGKYSARGSRLEGEYRYQSYGGIGGNLNVFYTRDRRDPFQENRSAIRTQHEWPFHPHFGMRWRFYEISDRDYPIAFPEDIQRNGFPALESNAVAQAPFEDFFVSAEAKRYRNFLYHDPVGFDGGTVQALPTVHVGLKERPLFGPFLGSFYGRYDQFTRRNGPFTDVNGNNNFDPTPTVPERLREASRYILTPEISAPFRIGPFLSISPSAQYHEIHYDFSLPTVNQNLSSTSTRYMQWKVEGSTTFERIYDYDSERVSKLKHQLSPSVTFSNIPWIYQPDKHPFQRQLRSSDGIFDQFDIAPLTNSTNFLRVPQGKSLYLGVTSRLIRKMKRPEELPRPYPYDILPATKKGKVPPPLNRKQELRQEQEDLWTEHNPHYESYQEIWNVSVSQAYDFIEAERHREDRRRAWSYLLAKSSFGLEQFSHDLEYRFYPRIIQRDISTERETVWSDKHWLSTSLTWYWAKKTNLRATRSFERSISLGFSNISQPNPSRNIGASLSWSFSDFVNMRLSHSYDLFAKRQIKWGVTTTLTHASECWGLVFHYDWDRSRGEQLGSGRDENFSDYGFQVLFNLTGTGFLGAGNLGQGGGPGGVFGGI